MLVDVVKYMLCSNQIAEDAVVGASALKLCYRFAGSGGNLLLLTGWFPITLVN